MKKFYKKNYILFFFQYFFQFFFRWHIQFILRGEKLLAFRKHRVLNNSIVILRA